MEASSDGNGLSGWATGWFQKVLLPAKKRTSLTNLADKQSRKLRTLRSHGSASSSTLSLSSSSSGSGNSSEPHLTLTNLDATLRGWLYKERVSVFCIGDVGCTPLLNTVLRTTSVTEAKYKSKAGGADHRAQWDMAGKEPEGYISDLRDAKAILPQPDFEACISWSAETATLQVLQAYVHTKEYDINNVVTFLVPEGRNAERVNWVMRYSPVPTLKIMFHNAMPEGTYVEDGKKWSSFLGKTMLFRGKGINLHVDRIYIRERLAQVLSGYAHLVKQCELGMPCGALDGNLDIYKISGT